MSLIGFPIAALTNTGPVRLSDLRRGMWWGLLLVTLLVYFINLQWSLASGVSATALILMVGFGTFGSVLFVKRRRLRPGLRWHRGAAVLIASLSFVLVYLAVATLGPVSNYDTGLYHLGAIRYAAEFPAIPGIANLYFPLGYGGAAPPLAGLLQATPWGLDGFRLLNGLVLSAVMLDLLLRTLSRRWTCGFFVALAGTVVLLVPMIWMADYWVASPSQDTAVFAITVATTGILADAVAARRRWVTNAAAACALCVVLVLLRPTMAIFLLAVLIVVTGLWWRRRGVTSPQFKVSAVIVLMSLLIAATAASLRDRILSGWLQYPLSIFSFDVPWRAPNPENDRIATLGFHRDSTDLWNAAKGYDWIASWFIKNVYEWESALLLMLTAVLAGLLVVAKRAGPIKGQWLMVTVAPSVVTSVAWFVATPPAFRFAWGPLFTCFTIPIGWAVWRIHVRPGKPLRVQHGRVVVAASGLVILSTTIFSASVRLDPLSITDQRSWLLGVQVPYAVAPLPDVGTVSGLLPGGVSLQMPLMGEQCWDAFPACTPRRPVTLRSRANDIREGFLS